MFQEIYQSILYFLNLNLNSEVFWNVLPLAIATILIVLYFETYKHEKPDWESYFSNSLVLLFVAMSLFRYIYNLDIPGIDNFLTYYEKSSAVVLLVFFGIALAKVNFGHVLPKKIARFVSSELTVNLIAYAVILFVFSELELSFVVFTSLILIIAVLSLILNLIRFPLRKMSEYLKKEKEKEEINNAKEIKFQIKETKQDLRYKEKELKKNKLKEAEKEKRRAIKVKKILKKI